MRVDVSIIVPVYNSAVYLKKCVDSIINQSFKNIEIILVNDGSTDNQSLKICREYENIDSRIKVIDKPNGGLSDARNAGLDIAQGEYVGFVDSDDYIETDMYQVLFTSAKKFNADISTCGWYEEYSHKSIVHSNTPIDKLMSKEEYIVEMYRGEHAAILVQFRLYHRERVFNKLRFPYGRVFEDSYVLYEVLGTVDKIAVNSIPCYHYIRHSNSITTGYENLEYIKQGIETDERNFNIVREAYPTLASYAEKRLYRTYYLSIRKLILNESNDAMLLLDKCRSELLGNIDKLFKDESISKVKRLIRALFIVFAKTKICRKLALIEHRRRYI